MSNALMKAGWSATLSTRRCLLSWNPRTVEKCHFVALPSTAFSTSSRSLVSRPSSRSSTPQATAQPNPAKSSTVSGKAVTISKAMKSYLHKAREHDSSMKTQIAEYEIGKRHLANMMGVDPDNFTQDDIDRAIQYILPSGLHEPKARPMMKHPSQLYAAKKAVEFDESGRPFHSMFYTTRPNYFQSLHDLAEKLQRLDKYEDEMIQKGSEHVESNFQADLKGTDWLNKEELESIFLEGIRDEDYTYFVVSMNRLVSHPYSGRVTDFIQKFRKKLVSAASVMAIPKLMVDEVGRPYMEAFGGRKFCRVKVIVKGNGNGKFEIDDTDIAYFESQQCRQQLLFPLQFTELLGLVDVKATVIAGDGFTAQAGAIRHGLSCALRSFVSPDMVEKMRLAGLLTRDPRCRERKKPGQEGARRKYTWRKR